MKKQSTFINFKLLFDFIENDNVLKLIKRKTDEYTVPSNARDYVGYPLDFVDDTYDIFSATYAVIDSAKSIPREQIENYKIAIKKLQEASLQITDPGFMRYTSINRTPIKGAQLLGILREILQKDLAEVKIKVYQIKIKMCDEIVKEYSDHLTLSPSSDPIYEKKKNIIHRLTEIVASHDDSKTKLDNMSNFMKNNEDVISLKISRDGQFKSLIKFILKLFNADDLIEKLDNKTVTGRFFIKKMANIVPRDEEATKKAPSLI